MLGSGKTPQFLKPFQQNPECVKIYRPSTLDLGVTEIKTDDPFPSGGGANGPDGSNSNDSCLACLVAVGRVQPLISSAIGDAVSRGRVLADGVEFVAR